MTPLSATKERGLATFMKGQNGYSINERAHEFQGFLKDLKSQETFTYQRVVTTPTDRKVIVQDAYGRQNRMLHFASNSYLGLSNHPRIKAAIHRAVDSYGVGMGGPPLLNGYSALMQEAEEKLAAAKGMESAVIFPSGYMANLGLIDALASATDAVIYDQLSHASLYDGIRISGCKSFVFSHNSTRHLKLNLRKLKGKYENKLVCVEGVYSMDGDLAPLDEIAEACRGEEAMLIVDDAHGLGVLGPNGAGTVSHFGVTDQVDIIMGTFSKSLAVAGGFLAGSKELMDYIRFYARPHVFSAALPPMVLAAVVEGLNVIKEEPQLREKLWENIEYAKSKLSPYGLGTKSQSAILALHTPREMDIRSAGNHYNKAGVFINTIEYPAVSVRDQRFRVSISANHTFRDIDRLTEVTDQIWSAKKHRQNFELHI